MSRTAEDLEDLRAEFTQRSHRCGECGLRGEHMPNCPGDPEPEPQPEPE